MFLANELYLNGRFQEAVEVFDRSIARGGDTYLMQILRCYALAELPDGPARALAAMPEPVPTLAFADYAPTVLQLLGRKAEAVAAYRSLLGRYRRAADGNEGRVRREWKLRLLEFCAGDTTSDALLAAAGTSRLDRCEAHFFIGMARLAEGDREDARLHFRSAVDTQVLWYVDHTWSGAFLSRMDADPNWPPWLPRSR